MLNVSCFGRSLAIVPSCSFLVACFFSSCFPSCSIPVAPSRYSVLITNSPSLLPCCTLSCPFRCSFPLLFPIILSPSLIPPSLFIILTPPRRKHPSRRTRPHLTLRLRRRRTHLPHHHFKRSTFIGTLHWMAPELFASSSPSSPLSYGAEVDIWAFGAVVYELATGLPPNAAGGVPYGRPGRVAESGVPRLEGGEYSEGLRWMVWFCLVENPSARPGIEEVHLHPYI